MKVALVAFAVGVAFGWHLFRPHLIDFFTDDFADSNATRRLRDDLDERRIPYRILSGDRTKWGRR